MTAAAAASGDDPLVLLSLAVTGDRKMLAMRRDVQEACRRLGMSEAETVRLATVVGEVGGSLLGARGLTGRLALVDGERPRITAVFGWSGALRPPEGALDAARRLLHTCELHDNPFSQVILGQPVPQTSQPLAERAAGLREELMGLGDVSMGEELRSQNHDLLAALQQARAHQEELQRLNQELEETNQGVMALYAELSSELEATNSGVVALYAELEEKTRELSLLNKAKTRFWANVSHELRSPVNGVLGLTRLLLATGAEPLTDEQVQQVQMIASAGSTMLALVEELLDVAKAESGRLEPELVPVDLRMLLHQMRGTLSGTAQPGASLVFPDDAPQQPVVTDEVMLTRILRNVLSNSLKFTAQGEVVLRVERAERAGRPWCVLTVTDTGIGIPVEEQARVFEEFYQVRGPHQRAHSGTGLGLPYARRLTELLGGRMMLDSTPGEGTRVVVEIPAGPHAATPGGDPAAAPVQLDLLVVVDDDPVFRATVRPVLAELAREVVEVGDSSEAVAVIRRRLPDAVLLDLSMPPPDGYQLLARLADDPGLSRLPVVVLTSNDPSGLENSRLAHAQAVLGKTHLSAARLADVLAPVLGRRAAAGAGTEER
ncbi:hybrid sensor histidine kinase/response regulator [Streptomyces cocklensis]|uniref:histidine kinase n=1 Tax=Actinacidiphila cocklensis TaxID=887465 RepID=A0A9W4E3R2_9ACTN|nr:hybrid sensor histidine kinase/response regulator [Actinacidiphila cocklensis]MDD1058769.1 hybrid sensor histidine kinase/response regulator [Actinacidiphila cocklensis]CAG6398887.1 Putative SigmaB asociated two-component system sensor protein [Actinacidiphila cocklensis]